MAKSAKLKIQQWGDSLAVRIPATIARSARFEADQDVEMATHENGVTLRPIAARQPTLADRLAQFDPETHGGESMKASRRGAEIF